MSHKSYIFAIPKRLPGILPVFLISISSVFMIPNQGPVSLTFFADNSNSMKTSPGCNSTAAHQIATNFAHATTAVLSWHVENFVAITVLELRGAWDEISMEFEKRLVKRGPALQPPTCLSLQVCSVIRAALISGVGGGFRHDYVLLIYSHKI